MDHPTIEPHVDAILAGILREIGDRPELSSYAELASLDDPQPFRESQRPVRLFDRVTCTLSRVEWDLLRDALRRTELEAAIMISKARYKRDLERAQAIAKKWENGVPY